MKPEPLSLPFSKLSLLIIGSTLTLLAIFLIQSKPAAPPKNETVSQLKTPPPLPAKSAVAMPDLRTLAMNLNGATTAPPTPAQLAEEKRVVAEQVDLAITWLKSSIVQTRTEGAEQLGAYLSPKSVTALTGALRKDTSPAVRLAAAQSLSQSETPDSATITVLLDAIADTDEQVASTALSALEVYLDTSPVGSTWSNQIRQGLRAQSKNRRLTAALRTRLMAVLNNT